jgi:hypothetical protein
MALLCAWPAQRAGGSWCGVGVGGGAEVFGSEAWRGTTPSVSNASVECAGVVIDEDEEQQSAPPPAQEVRVRACVRGRRAARGWDAVARRGAGVGTVCLRVCVFGTRVACPRAPRRGARRAIWTPGGGAAAVMRVASGCAACGARRGRAARARLGCARASCLGRAAPV